jgi:hypothetical protein
MIHPMFRLMFREIFHKRPALGDFGLVLYSNCRPEQKKLSQPCVQAAQHSHSDQVRFISPLSGTWPGCNTLLLSGYQLSTASSPSIFRERRKEANKKTDIQVYTRGLGLGLDDLSLLLAARISVSLISVYGHITCAILCQVPAISDATYSTLACIWLSIQSVMAREIPLPSKLPSGTLTYNNSAR